MRVALHFKTVYVILKSSDGRKTAVCSFPTITRIILQFSDHHSHVQPVFDVEEEERVGCFAFVVLRMSC